MAQVHFLGMDATTAPSPQQAPQTEHTPHAPLDLSPLHALCREATRCIQSNDAAVQVEGASALLEMCALLEKVSDAMNARAMLHRVADKPTTPASLIVSLISTAWLGTPASLQRLDASAAFPFELTMLAVCFVAPLCPSFPALQVRCYRVLWQHHPLEIGHKKKDPHTPHLVALTRNADVHPTVRTDAASLVCSN
jgi:hypothetical protein